MKEDKFSVTVEEDLEDEYSIRSVLKVIRNGEVVVEETDGGEPEDHFFFRDWSWVEDAIENAYKYGLEDGRGEKCPGCESNLKRGR